jgi:hypothetical protein
MQNQVVVGEQDGRTSIFGLKNSIIFPAASGGKKEACMPMDEEHR